MARLIIVDDNQELAALIASAVRVRGHAAITAHDGKTALEAIALIPCDLAIVDLLLPDMLGGELLAKLRAAHVRTVAISGVYKGEKFSREAIGTHGAAAYFEKPFEMSILLDAIDAIAGSAIPRPSPPLAVDEPFEEPTPAEETQPPEWGEDVLPLPFATRQDVWERPKPASRASREADFTQAGDLRTSSVPRLLTAYYQAKHFGELTLRQGNVIKVVCFERGQPVYAASNLAQERFGRFCVRRGRLSTDALEAVFRACKEQNIRTGEWMVRNGMITADERLHLLEDQIREIIWSTFNWNDGHFQFHPKRQTRTDLVKLMVFPGDLIVQGVSKTESLIGLRKRMPPGRRLFPNSDPPYALQDIALTGPQASLLVQADGSKTVEDLLALTDLSEREALALLVGFELLSLLGERREESKLHRISYGF